MKSITRLKQILIICVISSVLLIVTAEIFFRVQGTYLSWTEVNAGKYVSPYHIWENATWFWTRPADSVLSYKEPEFNFELKTNSLGLRDIEHPVEKNPDTVRIMGVGDSFTKGQGAPFDKTWLKVLEKNLNCHLGFLKFSTMSGGVAGSDPFYSYQLLDKKLLKYQPDIVILAINYSDIIDVIARGGFDRFLPNGTIQYASPPTIEWLFAKSHFVRFILFACFKYDWLLLCPVEKRMKVDKVMEELNSLILKFKEQSEKANYKLLIVFHLLLWELKNKRYEFDFSQLKSYAAANDIQSFDLLDYFLTDKEAGQCDPNALYWQKDSHHTPLGYEYFAKGVERILYDANFIEKPGHELRTN